MSTQPKLRTSRLILRPFQLADSQRVSELANDEELARNLRSFEYPYSLKDAQKWLESLGGEWENGQSAVFAVCPRQSDRPDQPDEAGRLVGAIGVVIDQQSNRGELGYWIGREYWGQGFATAAANSTLDFAFSQLGLNRIVAECLVRNPASARVLEKLGMEQEGFFAQHFRKNESDEYCDVLSFGLLRQTWNARK